jgi:hypothetical protein
MKMSDILRNLAELLDQQQGGVEPGHDEAHQATLTPVEVSRTSKDEVDSGHYIPPLQAKLELLKKGVGVQSAYDKDGNGVPDELETLRKNAGINPVVVHAAADDEPLDI